MRLRYTFVTGDAPGFEIGSIMKRLSIWYTGRVQGVGFRATCVELSRDFQIVGRVCNLTDGRVELVVEGEQAELERFRDRVAIEMRRYIQQQKDRWSDALGNWESFSVAPDKQPDG
jgi:acylphosphatase